MKYTDLGALYAPTPSMLQMAADDRTFYAQAGGNS